MPPRLDLVVVGAGSTGAALAAMAARAGMRVRVVERRAVDEGGARWVNDVPRWCFTAARFSEPPDHVVAGPREGFAATLFAGWGPHKLEVGTPAVLPIDMRALVAWLLDEARAAGVEVQGGVRVRGYRDGALATDDGSIAADFVVDASGLSGVNLLGLPTAAREGVCVAAQEVRVVRDRAAAEAFFVSRGVDPRGAANFVGLHGGFSTLLVRLQDDTVGLLAGSLPALGHPPGRTMLERFAADHAWVGARIYGGQAPIPLAPSFAPVAGDRVAHVGDAARQVFSAHGSGVGSGLVAARLFVDAMVAGEGGRGYAQRWVREYGGLHGTYDLFRRFSATLDARDLGVLFDSGFVDRESALAGIEQRFPRLDASDLREKIGAIRRCPRLAMRLLRFVGRAPAMIGLARTYPRHELGQRRAGAAMAALVRDLPP